MNTHADIDADTDTDREVTCAERQSIRMLLVNYQRELNTPPLKLDCALYMPPGALKIEKRISNTGRILRARES